MKEHEFDAGLFRPEGVGTWTYLDIPADISREFGTIDQVPVKGFISGHPFRTSARPHGDGRHYIVVNKSIRDAIGATAGDVVRVMMSLDSAPRIVEIPADFMSALESEGKRAALFQALSPSRQREFVVWLESAKRAETRGRRITQALVMLTEGISPKRRKM